MEGRRRAGSQQAPDEPERQQMGGIKPAEAPLNPCRPAPSLPAAAAVFMAFPLFCSSPAGVCRGGGPVRFRRRPAGKAPAGRIWRVRGAFLRGGPGRRGGAPQRRSGSAPYGREYGGIHGPFWRREKFVRIPAGRGLQTGPALTFRGRARIAPERSLRTGPAGCPYYRGNSF